MTSASMPVIVVGAGGHALVVADALLAAGTKVLGFTDAASHRRGERCLGDLLVIGGDDALSNHDPARVRLVNGLGSILANGPECSRVRVQQQLESEGWRFIGVKHPSAVVSPFARIDETAQVMAGAVVQPHAHVGRGCIVNTGAVVEHDTDLDDWVHVAPGAIVCGNVRLGSGVHVGAGSVIRQSLSLGSGVVVGIGAVVVKDQTEAVILAGVPARAREKIA
jgi:sugar O-acyltransferase (sialic acid O-acetyltransferase NeuD family)